MSLPSRGYAAHLLSPPAVMPSSPAPRRGSASPTPARGYAANLLSPPSIMPGGRPAMPLTGRTSPRPGSSRRIPMATPEDRVPSPVGEETFHLEPWQLPQQGRARRRLVNRETSMRRRTTVSSAEEGRAILARGASVRRTNVWDSVPEPGQEDNPPPPFPFPTTSNSRAPPSFAQSDREGSNPPPEFDPAWEPPIPLLTIPDSPPPSFEAVIGERAETPASVYASAPSGAASDAGGPDSDAGGVDSASGVGSGSEDGDEGEQERLDRRQWNADIHAGYTLEERVAREAARREAREAVRAAKRDVAENSGAERPRSRIEDEQARQVEEARQADEARQAEERRLKEEQERLREQEREEARQAEEARQREEAERQAKLDAEAKRVEEAERAEEEKRKKAAAAKRRAARKAEAARLAEEARKAEAARQAEEARKAELARQAEEARQAEAARQAEETRRVEAAKRAEEARKAEEARRAAALEQVRRAELEAIAQKHREDAERRRIREEAAARRAREEAAQRAREREEAQRRAREKAEAERRAHEKEQAELRAREKAEAARKEQERLEAERKARAKDEADRLARQQAAAAQKAEEEAAAIRREELAAAALRRIQEKEAAVKPPQLQTATAPSSVLKSQRTISPSASMTFPRRQSTPAPPKGPRSRSSSATSEVSSPPRAPPSPEQSINKQATRPLVLRAQSANSATSQGSRNNGSAFFEHARLHSSPDISLKSVPERHPLFNKPWAYPEVLPRTPSETSLPSLAQGTEPISTGSMTEEPLKMSISDSSLDSPKARREFVVLGRSSGERKHSATSPVISDKTYLANKPLPEEPSEATAPQTPALNGSPSGGTLQPSTYNTPPRQPSSLGRVMSIKRAGKQRAPDPNLLVDTSYDSAEDGPGGSPDSPGLGSLLHSSNALLALLENGSEVGAAESSSQAAAKADARNRMYSELEEQRAIERQIAEQYSGENGDHQLAAKLQAEEDARIASSLSAMDNDSPPPVPPKGNGKMRAPPPLPLRPSSSIRRAPPPVPPPPASPRRPPPPPPPQHKRTQALLASSARANNTLSVHTDEAKNLISSFPLPPATDNRSDGSATPPKLPPALPSRPLSYISSVNSTPPDTFPPRQDAYTGTGDLIQLDDRPQPTRTASRHAPMNSFSSTSSSLFENAERTASPSQTDTQQTPSMMSMRRLSTMAVPRPLGPRRQGAVPPPVPPRPWAKHDVQPALVPQSGPSHFKQSETSPVRQQETSPVRQTETSPIGSRDHTPAMPNEQLVEVDAPDTISSTVAPTTPRQPSPPQEPEFTEYTDADVYASRLEGTAREFENLHDIIDFVAQEEPTATPEMLNSLLCAPVEVESRRVNANGKVKVKLSVLGVRVTNCPVCLSQFRSGDSAVLLPNCGHVAHDGCARKWLKRSDTCMVCRTRLGE